MVQEGPPANEAMWLLRVRINDKCLKDWRQSVAYPFWCWRRSEVAKIVHCGEHLSPHKIEEEAIRKGGLNSLFVYLRVTVIR